MIGEANSMMREIFEECYEQGICLGKKDKDLVIEEMRGYMTKGNSWERMINNICQRILKTFTVIKI